MLIFAEGTAPSLSSETAQVAALLKAEAESLPATTRAVAALGERGLLTWLDGDPSIFVVDQVAATAIDEACVVALHQFGALGLLHAGLVSLSHLTWMEKAERLLTAAPSENPVPLPDHKRTADWSGFLTALATDSSAEENLIQFPEPSRS